MAATREASIIGGVRRSHRRLQSWSRRLARAELRTQQRLYFVNCQIHRQSVLGLHQQTKLTRTISILEPLLIKQFVMVSIKSTTCTKQITLQAHPPHDLHVLVKQTNIGNIFRGSAHQIRGNGDVITIRGCNNSQDYRRPFSVVAALVPLARKLAQRRRHSVDEFSKFEGASSKSIPEGKRALALAAAPHQKSSPLISAQEKSQSDVKC